jgi:hypothetical protein
LPFLPFFPFLEELELEFEFELLEEFELELLDEFELELLDEFELELLEEFELEFPAATATGPPSFALRVSAAATGAAAMATMIPPAPSLVAYVLNRLLSSFAGIGTSGRVRSRRSPRSERNL